MSALIVELHWRLGPKLKSKAAKVGAGFVDTCLARMRAAVSRIRALQAAALAAEGEDGRHAGTGRESGGGSGDDDNDNNKEDGDKDNSKDDEIDKSTWMEAMEAAAAAKGDQNGSRIGSRTGSRTGARRGGSHLVR